MFPKCPVWSSAWSRGAGLAGPVQRYAALRDHCVNASNKPLYKVLGSHLGNICSQASSSQRHGVAQGQQHGGVRVQSGCPKAAASSPGVPLTPGAGAAVGLLVLNIQPQPGNLCALEQGTCRAGGDLQPLAHQAPSLSHRGRDGGIRPAHSSAQPYPHPAWPPLLAIPRFAEMCPQPSRVDTCLPRGTGEPFPAGADCGRVLWGSIWSLSL